MAVEQGRGMSGNALTKKVGPLPVWGWAVGLLVAYFLYQRYKGSAAGNASSTQGTPSGSGGADMNPVPVGVPQNDSGLGSGFGGGPTTINNYYGSNPADTGGTGAGSGPPPSTPPVSPPGLPGVPISPGPITTVPISLPPGWPGTQPGGGQPFPGGFIPAPTPTGSSVPLSSYSVPIYSSGFVPSSAVVRSGPGAAKAV